MEKFKIDDVAKLCGLTKRTIRYYEELGLIPPPERSEGGMRLYTQQHIERLNQIVNARDVLGFSLQEILDFVSIREKLGEHRDAYRQTEETEIKKRQLLDIQQIIIQQMEMVDRKLEKMAQFRKELEQLSKRVHDGIDKLTT